MSQPQPLSGDTPQQEQEQGDQEQQEQEQPEQGDQEEGIEPPDPPKKPRQKETPEDRESDESDEVKDTSDQHYQKQGDYVDYGTHVRQSDSKGPDTTATLEPLAHATPEQWLGTNNDPDVLLSIPNLGIDHIGLNVKNIRAHVDLHAKVLDLVEINVGADVSIDEVDLQINNVRVQAMLKVKLDKVAEIVGRVVELLDNHPEILSNLTGGLGRGLEGALSRKPPEGGKQGLTIDTSKMDDRQVAQLEKAIRQLESVDSEEQQERDKEPANT